MQEFRQQHGDAYYFNWRLVIDRNFQMPFEATHETMATLKIDEGTARMNSRPICDASSPASFPATFATTRCAIEEHGPFTINGSAKIMSLLDDLLAHSSTRSA